MHLFAFNSQNIIHLQSVLQEAIKTKAVVLNSVQGKCAIEALL